MLGYGVCGRPVYSGGCRLLGAAVDGGATGVGAAGGATGDGAAGASDSSVPELSGGGGYLSIPDAASELSGGHGRAGTNVMEEAGDNAASSSPSLPRFAARPPLR